jgi:hypothetical protein
LAPAFGVASRAWGVEVGLPEEGVDVFDLEERP